MKVSKKKLTELAGSEETKRVSNKLANIPKTKIQLLDGSIKVIEKVKGGFEI